MLKYIALVAAFATTSAFASPSQAYVSAGIGESQYKDACEVEVGNCEDTDTAFRVGVGFLMQENLALELNYINHGEAVDDYVDGGLYDRYSIEAQTLALQVAATAPINDAMALFGKIGVAQTKATLENNYDLGFVSGHDSIDSSEAGLIVSAGASFELMPNLNAQFQLDYLPKAIKSDEVDFDTDIQSYSVGLQFKF